MMKYLFSIMLILSANVADAASNKPLGLSSQHVQHVPSNSALSAIPSTAVRVVRDGYKSSGDSPPLTYTASDSACSLNSGAGDGGSQIPTSDGKCWIAKFPTNIVDARWFGAVGITSKNSTSAIQAAIDYAETLSAASPNTGGGVYLPSGNYLVNSSLIVNQSNFSLIGDGRHQTILSRNAAYGDTLTVNNGGLIQNITIRGITFYHDVNAGNSMTGAHINVKGGTHVNITDVGTLNGKYGITIQGGTYISIDNTHIKGAYLQGSSVLNSTAGLYFTATKNSGTTPLPSIVNVTRTQINQTNGTNYAFRYPMVINAMEEGHFVGDTFNGGYYAQVYLQQTASNSAILEVTFSDDFIDGDGEPSRGAGPWYGMSIDGSLGNGSKPISRIKIVNVGFNGEARTPHGATFGIGLHIDGTNRGGAYPQALQGLVVANSQFQGYYKYGINAAGGVNLTFTGNQIFNNNNSNTNGIAGLQMGASVNKFLISGNISGPLGSGATKQKYGMSFLDGAIGTVIGNNLCGNRTGAVSDSTSAPTTAGRKILFFDNKCWNSSQAASVQPVAASGVNQYNAKGQPMWMRCTGGTSVTAIAVNGTNIATSTPAQFMLGANQYYTITYSSTPTCTGWPQ